MCLNKISQIFFSDVPSKIFHHYQSFEDNSYQVTNGVFCMSYCWVARTIKQLDHQTVGSSNSWIIKKLEHQTVGSFYRKNKTCQQLVMNLTVVTTCVSKLKALCWVQSNEFVAVKQPYGRCCMSVGGYIPYGFNCLIKSYSYVQIRLKTVSSD